MLTQEALNKRIPYLDTVRVIACLLVLLVHAPIIRYSEYYDTPNAIYPFYITLITVSSKLFFLLSGALLLPTKKTMREFLPRRLKVVLFPLLFWSIAYIIHRIAEGTFSPKIILSILFYPVEGSLWFVYVMVIIYILMPFMSRCIEAVGKKGVELYLILWTLSSLIPYQHGIFFGWDQFSHNMLSGVANYLGYVVLGYYLHNYPLPIFTKKHGWKFALFFVFGIVIMPLFEFLVQGHFGITYQQHIDTITNDISINDVAMSILIFSVAKHFSPASYTAGTKHRLSMAATKISICTFGIYLCHMLVLKIIVWPLTRDAFGQLHWLADGLLCMVITFIVSYTIIRLIYMLPKSKYLIGH